MSHDITISEVAADIELDYTDIWENIEDSVSEAARDAVRDYAWDEVSSEVEQYVDDHVSGHSSDINESLEEALDEYNRMKAQGGSPCSLGRAFERAVGFAAEITDGDAATAIADLTKRMLDQERLLSNLLGQIERLGEHAGTLGRGVRPSA